MPENEKKPEVGKPVQLGLVSPPPPQIINEKPRESQNSPSDKGKKGN